MEKTVSNFIKHIECTACGSSDGNSTYDDGHEFCHVCRVYKSGNGVVLRTSNKPNREHVMEFKTPIYDAMQSRSMVDRGISSQTCAFFGVRANDNTHCYPYFDSTGVLSSIKTRNIKDKLFSIQGTHTVSGLFGQNKFNKGGKFITITEGELDALSAFQMMGSKYPVVSVKNGASAAFKDCQTSFEYLDSFENIVICFDADEPGIKAANKVAELFGSKAKILKNSDTYKDANDYLKNNASAKFNADWWAAEQFTPDGIVQGSTLWEEVSKAIAPADCLYPWKGLNELTYGIRKGELVTVTAGSGLGKSQFLRELVWHVLQNTDSKVGLMFLEESVQKTARSVMSLAINKPIHLPDVVVSDEELKYAFDHTLGTNRIYLFDHFGSLSLDNVINRVKYMAKGCGCDYIFLDHISIIVSGGDVGDERKAIDSIMTRLRTLVQETGVSLICVSHLKRPSDKGHEEGAATTLAQLRGSGAIAQLSDIVIGLERNGQATDLVQRNTTHIRVLKNRFSGTTGPASNLHYSSRTGRMIEVKEDVL